ARAWIRPFGGVAKQLSVWGIGDDVPVFLQDGSVLNGNRSGGAMNTSIKRLTIFVLLALTLGVIPAQAQVTRASIIGNVTDKTGAALGGVVVTVTHEETNTAINATTSETGAFTAVNLIPGSYTISARHAGFAPVTYRNFVVQVSQQARLNFVMELGALEQ